MLPVRRVGLVGLLAGVMLSGCAGGGSTEQPSPSSTQTVNPSTATTPTLTTSASPTQAPARTLPPGVDQVVTVSVSKGKVTGPKGRVKVRQGSTVQLVVSSDVSDEVHLHGYDKSVDVTPGGPARLTFTASIPGVFEVELESRQLRLAQLQVA